MTQYRKLIDTKECQRCGATERIEVHHMDLDHYNDDPDNLIALCIYCHKQYHACNWELEELGIKTPPIRRGESFKGTIFESYFNVTMEDLQKELATIEDPICRIRGDKNR